MLDQLSTTEMQNFWDHFASERALSAASTTVPYWKTKEQERCYQREFMNLIFYPKEKDSSGKNIIVRKDLEEHIKIHILRHIQDKRRSEQAFRDLPLFERLHVRIGLTVVFMSIAAIPVGICLLIFSWLFHVNLLAVVIIPAISVFMALWCLYLLMIPVRALLRKCNLWNDTP